ncbi:hypothetical protein BDV96DRAFT_644734 [Lophiotrema nucula]|uniref:Uncharacterized protein n=1 Tax=Lophiotrema nucula TaxID=690887 RepID=A0A6A5ZCS5_9PLEO|nr:hypothetical protein BDV96DRAFT_644734 [Lophiotrema nucula]
MASIWLLANIKDLEFAAAATLLAIRAKQQSLFAAEQSDIEFSDESESEYDSEEEWATSKPTARLTTYSRDALIDKFLDRLGEFFSREKSSVQHGSRQGSKHVAATAWIGPGTKSPLTIILAKNEGLDDRDRKMSSHLQLWLRTVAATGRHSSLLVDIIWIGEIGLIEYSCGRLNYYVSQINQLDQSMNVLAARSGIYGPVITCLQCLCQNATKDSTVRQLSDIVNVAYILRYTWKVSGASMGHMKAVRSINMLGRLRAAYECFKTVALTFEEISTMEMRPVTLHQHVEINVSLFRKTIQRLAGEFQLPKGLLKNNTAQKYTGASRLHIHAEMQILVCLARNADWHGRAHGYVGISRKPCFLCNEILQNYSKISVEGARQPAFKSRRSHGKVYPLWTLPQSEIVPYVASLAIATATTHAYRHILQHLQHEPVLQAAIAESSAGVTESASTTGDFTAVKKQFLANQRTWSTSEMVAGSEESIALGRKIKSVRVGLLPADGSKPRLIPINFHALPENGDRRIRESGHDYVPDFYDSWGECQFDRRYQILSLQNQAIKESEGDYRLYWNENHELPENENVKKLLGIKKVGAIRRFWYGDVFVVRFSEHPKTFAYNVYDAPTAIFQCLYLERVFQNMWENRFLEAELERDRYHEAHDEKREADKEIILRRMLVWQTGRFVAILQS